MIINKTNYGYNDVSIVPAKSSSVNSRSEVNPKDALLGGLPIFTAPMSTVVNFECAPKFNQYGITPIIPRSESWLARFDALTKGEWVAVSLKEFEEMFCNKPVENSVQSGINYKVCIDIANGHMEQLFKLCKKAKRKAMSKNDYTLTIMTGNIANPETYRYISELQRPFNTKEPIIDFIRVGIGNGAGCITSSNTGVHYPIASLIDECHTIKRGLERENIKCPYIIADGGIRNYSDIIKALALGADYVMVGSLFAGLLESAAKKYAVNADGWIEHVEHPEAVFGTVDMFALFYGMASANGQKDLKAKKRTAEGITKHIPVIITLPKWTENMEDYLRSAMSYCGCLDLDEFKNNCVLVVNSAAELASVNK